MDKITDVTTEELGDSEFIKPFRMRYKQNGTERIWDCIQAHDSVAVLIHHIEHDTFIIVRQFRAPVYISKVRSANNGVNPKKVENGALPGDAGITYELCAGILDKPEASIAEVAKQEVLEECGYDVPLENLELITVCRSGVGHAGTEQTMYYAQVTEKMKKTEGGGNKSEGEMIDVIELDVKDSLDFVFDTKKERPISFMYAVLWYHSVKAKQLTKT